jgi:tripartite-type tricarboxylate transporter receptor subunit TctC
MNTSWVDVKRRRALGALGALGLLGVAPARMAIAQGNPIRIVVGNPPGGTVDLLARILADDIGKATNQPTIVENRPGANGNLAAEYVLRAPPDGQTLFLAAPGPFVTHGALYPNLRFDPKTAFAPISVLAVAPLESPRLL